MLSLLASTAISTALTLCRPNISAGPFASALHCVKVAFITLGCEYDYSIILNVNEINDKVDDFLSDPSHSENTSTVGLF